MDNVEKIVVPIVLVGMALSAYFIFDILFFIFEYFWYIVGAGLIARIWLAFTMPHDEFMKSDPKKEESEVHYRVLESNPGSGYKHFWIRKD